ncbi:Uncharacterized protein APZ42_028927 [Daphnia magna]|uniref:DDE Tnp4 domain-containing protein n=1 Tax=Daphnia magna TaxID=35525 RepID=A0A164Q2W2_9CRUS|nr:Uncharacterized protein APZ42_028927 [Daphnia magna]
MEYTAANVSYNACIIEDSSNLVYGDRDEVEALFKSLKPALRNNTRFAVTLEEQFLITLMKLRLNLSRRDIAYRFKIIIPTVTSYMEKFVYAMFIRLPVALLRKPDRETALKTLPLSFRAQYPNVNYIIDCTELKCETTSDRIDAVSCYSTYKSHHTSKFTIVNTPHGSVAFLSKTFTGRATDVDTIRQSGLVEFIEPGDEILADRDFINEGDFTSLGAKVHIPSFKSRRDQLTCKETERNRKQLNKEKFGYQRKWILFWTNLLFTRKRFMENFPITVPKLKKKILIKSTKPVHQEHPDCGGPIGEDGVLRPSYLKYYEEVLGLDNPCVASTAIPVKNTFFSYFSLKIVINSSHLQGNIDTENQTRNVQEQQLAIINILESTPEYPENNSFDANIDEESNDQFGHKFSDDE